MKEMLFTLILCSIATAGWAADGPFPEGTTGHETVSAAGKPERIVESPSGQYSIITSCRSEFTGPAEYRRCDAGLHTTLHFRDKSKPDATLAVDFPDTILGQSRYFFSPDERWIIRSQHIGAGVNDLTLYSVASNGKVGRVELNKLAFDYAFTGVHCSQDQYRHMQVEFMSWDLVAGLVHLNADATPNDKDACPQIDREVVYDLKKHRMRAE
jgi:hypothetical protein